MINLSESQPDAPLEILNERQLSPDMADTSSFDDSSSSSDADGYRANIPLLLSIESPLVSAVVTVLNSTNVCRRLFSNEGKDIVNRIEFDPEWWRRMPDLSKRQERTQSEWEQSIRVQLQILNAFLCNRMHRQLAATGDLESLFRMKKNREDEPKLEVSTIFKILAQLPEYEDVLVSKVRVDGEVALVLPVPVSTNRQVSIQRALDETFWASALDKSDSAANVKVPYLEKLTDIFVVYCLEKGIKIAEKINPERYSSETADQIQKRLGSIKELNARQNEIQATLTKLTVLNGTPVIQSIEVAAEAMKTAKNESAYEELMLKVHQIKERKEELQKEGDSVTSQLEASIKNLLDPAQEASMTPYSIRALIWPDAVTEGPVMIFRGETPGMWHYICGSSYYKICWADAVKYALNNESYLAIYEKDEPDGSDYSLTLAPSVQAFIDQDDVHFDETKSDKDDSDEDRATDRNHLASSESSDDADYVEDDDDDEGEEEEDDDDVHEDERGEEGNDDHHSNTESKKDTESVGDHSEKYNHEAEL